MRPAGAENLPGARGLLDGAALREERPGVWLVHGRQAPPEEQPARQPRLARVKVYDVRPDAIYDPRQSNDLMAHPWSGLGPHRPVAELGARRHPFHRPLERSSHSDRVPALELILGSGGDEAAQPAKQRLTHM